MSFFGSGISERGKDKEASHGRFERGGGAYYHVRLEMTSLSYLYLNSARGRVEMTESLATHTVQGLHCGNFLSAPGLLMMW